MTLNSLRAAVAIAVITAAARGQTLPATTRAAEGEAVKETLRAMRLDAVRGDVDAVRARIAANGRGRAQVAEPSARWLVACEAAKALAREKLPPEVVGSTAHFGLPEPADIDAMSVRFAAPDSATLHDPHDPLDDMRLVRVGGAWLVDEAPPGMSESDLSTQAIMRYAFALAIERSLADFAPEAARASRTAIAWFKFREMVAGYASAMPRETQIDELRAMQADREADRASRAAAGAGPARR